MSEGKGPRELKVVVLTGLSGSGKTTALQALEDTGFFCVDNMPRPLVGAFLGLCDTQGAVRRVAVAIDIRDRILSGDLGDTLSGLAAPLRDLEVLFLDSSDEAIINRFKTTRRPHPVMAQGGAAHLPEAIALERAWLEPLRIKASRIVDTTTLGVHGLRHFIHRRFGDGATQAMRVHLYSFGFRHGLPPESDFVFDVRYLDNPYFVPHLRERSGLDAPVASFVLEQPLSQRLLDHIRSLLGDILPAIVQENRALLTIAIGCTGGHHRSVALTEALAEQLRAGGQEVVVRHRDLHRGA